MLVGELIIELSHHKNKATVLISIQTSNGDVEWFEIDTVEPSSDARSEKKSKDMILVHCLNNPVMY